MERSVGKGKILEAARERPGSGKIESSGRGPEDLGVGSHFFAGRRSKDGRVERELRKPCSSIVQPSKEADFGGNRGALDKSFRRGTQSPGGSLGRRTEEGSRESSKGEAANTEDGGRSSISAEPVEARGDSLALARSSAVRSEESVALARDIRSHYFCHRRTGHIRQPEDCCGAVIGLNPCAMRAED